MSLQYSPPEVSEDCLYLNVYTPAQARQGDKLPVRWTARNRLLDTRSVTMPTRAFTLFMNSNAGDELR